MKVFKYPIFVFGLSSVFLANTAQTAQAAALLFTDRAAFEATLGASITDDYSNPGYIPGDLTSFPGLIDIHSDASMSAVLGETRYETTGFDDNNLIFAREIGLAIYCGGCNGSYRLDFTSTSIGTANGVFGVGLDVLGETNPVFGATAFVTFGDGSTTNLSIPENSDVFWGITADELISSIHFGLPDGATADSNDTFRMNHDNLTIGARATTVSEPASLALLGLGLCGIASWRRRT